MSSQQDKITVLEDDPLVASIVTRTLAEYGFTSRWYRTAAEMLGNIDMQPPALVVLDLGLPDRDGMDVVRELRTRCDCGVLILTGRDVVSDRVLGLELGADDYVTKPFEPRELVARIRSILRRRSPHPAGIDGHRIACFDELRYDPASFKLTMLDGSDELLGTAEARLLLILLERPGRVLSREQLAGTKELHPLDRSIDVRVSRLRRRLRDDTQSPRLIKTVYGAGYVLVAEVRWESGVSAP